MNRITRRCRYSDLGWFVSWNGLHREAPKLSRDSQFYQLRDAARWGIVSKRLAESKTLKKPIIPYGI